MNYGRSMEMREAWPDTLDEDIYINSDLNLLTKLTISNRGTEFKDILLQKISQMIMKIVPISMRIVISNVMKQGIPMWCEYDEKSMESETRTISESPNGGKAIVEQILAPQERNKSKRAGLWESQFKLRVEKLTIWVNSFEIIKIITEFPGLSIPPE